MQKIIKVSNLKKNFLIKQKVSGFWPNLRSIFSPEYTEITAVNNISFDVNYGEMLAFIGPNGAGKSTTIKMLTGILFPTAGGTPRSKIDVLGFDPSKQRTELAFHIGSIFGQKSQLWYHLPAIDTFQLLYRIYELKYADYKERLDYLVKAFEIEPFIKTPVRQLSLGQRMRCELVASLLHRPKIIFLDEPTIGLDVIAKQQVRDMLKYLNQTEGVTIFLTSHDAGDIEAITKRTIIVNNGKIIFDDTTENLKKNYITSKVIELVTEEPIDNFKFEAGKILERKSHSLKVEIDTKVSSIEKLITYALENFKVVDINIFDTPLEKIISSLYSDKS